MPAFEALLTGRLDSFAASDAKRQRNSSMNETPSGSKNSARLPWVLLAVVVALVAGVTLYRQMHSHASETGPVAPDSASATASSPVGQGRDPQAGRQLRSAALTPEDMSRLIEKRKLMAAASQARIQQRNATMASSFAGEKPDLAWSVAHEKDLASLQDSGPMHDAGTKAENFRADCRSSMCRIQADFPNQTMAADWLQLYMSSVGDNLPVATAHQIRNPDGSVRVEIYGVGRKK